MSADSAIPTDVFESFQVTGWTVYATSAVVIYDYIITYEYEVEFVWKRKWNATTWIFLLNRYLMIATGVYQASPAIPQLCDAVKEGLFGNLTNGLQSLVFSAFDVLRVFALLTHDKWRYSVSGFLILLLMFIWAAQTYVSTAITVMYVDNPILGKVCATTGSTGPPNVESALYFTSVIGDIVSQLIVLVVTWSKTYSQAREASLLGMKAPLSQRLLRDGSIYFLFLLVINILNAILTFDNTLRNSPASSVLSPITNVLPYLFLSRFLISLRQLRVSEPGGHAPHEDSSRSFPSSLNFNTPTMESVIGNIGGSLDFTDQTDDSDGDEHGLEHAIDSNTDRDTEANCASDSRIDRNQADPGMPAGGSEGVNGWT